MESYGRRGGSGWRHNKEYGYRGRGGRRGRGTHRRYYDAEEDYHHNRRNNSRDRYDQGRGPDYKRWEDRDDSNRRDRYDQGRGPDYKRWEDRDDSNRRDRYDQGRGPDYKRREDRDDSTSRDQRDGEGSFRSRGRGRPRGLRGKEIGLYYARMGQKNKTERERQSRQFIPMDGQKERHISNLLANIRAADKVQPQPSRSYSDAFNDEEEEETFKMGSESTAFGAVPKSSRRRVPDTWSDDDENYDDKPPSGKRTPRERLSPTSTPSTSRECQDGATPSVSSWSDTTYQSTPGDGLESYSQEEVDDDDDDDGDDELYLGQDEQYDEPDDDYEEECKTVPKLADMFAWCEADSDFFNEFLSHNEANRRSTERLNNISQMNLKLQRNPDLDRELHDKLQEKIASNKLYQKMQTFRRKLPSFSMRNEILDVIDRNQVVVLSGETGCGKTTQVSQFILDDFIDRGDGSLCHIVCTQPRRISAITVAERVADERGEVCGEGSVGYQIRLEHKLPRLQGSILYCTTGIMLKWLASDPGLSKCTHVILDEVHERDLQTDFLMIILKDLLTLRSNLKLVLMSATLNAEKFSSYYGNCPMLNIPGYTFPVKEYLLEEVIKMTEYKHYGELEPVRKPRIHGKKRRELMAKQEDMEVWLRNLPDRYSQRTKDVILRFDFERIDLDLIVHLVNYICFNKGDGAILIFLPGWEQISTLHGMLQKMGLAMAGKFRMIPLHSQMPTVNQREVFERPPPGIRKIVIATNIAETSITIDDVVFVIDCGKIKIKNFDVENNIGTLMPEWVSKANAKQRRGRAGRVQPGECYHLYTGYHETKLDNYQLPEILRTRLEELCLQIKLLKLGKVRPFVCKAMQVPSLVALENAVENLMSLNALDENEDLTPLGYHLAKMPVDPHTGKMLLFGAMFCCLNPILTIAASLSFKDAFHIPLGREKEADKKRREISAGSKSDHIMLVRAYDGWERAKACNNANRYCWDNFLSGSTLRMLANMRQQFSTMLHDMGFLKSGDPKAPEANKYSGDLMVVKAIITAGLYPNVARIKKVKKGRGDTSLMTKTERTVGIHPKSVNADETEYPSQWLMYHLKMKTSKIFVYDCTMVTSYPLLLFGGDISIVKDEDQDCVRVDGWIVFRASPRIGCLVKELRAELDKLLAYKITHPSATNWDCREKEGALMNAILELFKSEV